MKALMARLGSWLGRCWSHHLLRLALLLSPLLAGLLAPTLRGEALGLGAALLGLTIYAAAAWLSAGNNALGTAGRGFLASRLGELLGALCGKWLPRLLGAGRSVALLCRVLVIAVGEGIHSLFSRWLRPQTFGYGGREEGDPDNPA